MEIRLLCALAAALTACGEVDSSGAKNEGSGGAQSSTGGASSGGASTGGVATGGSSTGGFSTGGSSTGGVAACEDGLQLLAVVAPAAGVRSVPELGDVLATAYDVDQDIQTFALYRGLPALEPGQAPQAQRFTLQDLGVPLLSLAWEIEISGGELFALGTTQLGIGALDGSHEGITLTLPTSAALNPGFWTGLAVGSDVLAISGGAQFMVATRVDGHWAWQAPQPFPDMRSGEVLGFVDGELFAALAETQTSSPGEPRLSAEVVRLTPEGEVIARYPARGNPTNFMMKDGGLLFSELNSYWGSLHAALEWLGPDRKELHTITDVPVKSSTDGADGAFATVVLDAGASGEQLYVANGESKLRRGAWSTESTTLSLVPGPWNGSPAVLGPMIASVASSGNVLVVPGVDEKLYFLKACSP